mmetsp:Transcript_9712/g.32203  ORF Transcript_9712/g.32203 Transcript_9712/m.32203 type:complete len:218 (+) Transcript_9712:1007-1660(+)
MHRRVLVAERGGRGAGRAHKRWVVLEVGVQLECNLVGQMPRPKEAAAHGEQRGGGGSPPPHPSLARPTMHLSLAVRLPLARDVLGRHAERAERSEHPSVLVLAHEPHAAHRRQPRRVDQPADAHLGGGSAAAHGRASGAGRYMHKPHGSWWCRAVRAVQGWRQRAGGTRLAAQGWRCIGVGGWRTEAAGEESERERRRRGASPWRARAAEATKTAAR